MISILTATYNRANKLPRLFSSLIAQASHDFEWIVVDDGSQDETHALIQCLVEQAPPFGVKYKRIPNSGKHVALNEGVALADGSFVFIVDSDDWLPPHSISKINSWALSVESRPDIAAIAGLKSTEDGSIPSGTPRISYPFVEATNRERIRYGLRGDSGAEAYRTDILRAHPFPHFSGETFLHEALVWNRIADAGYTIRWHPVVVYHYEYQEGGLTDNGLSNHVQNFRGYSLYVKEAMAKMGRIDRFRTLGSFAQVANRAGLSFPEAAREANVSVLSIRLALIVKLLHSNSRKILMSRSVE